MTPEERDVARANARAALSEHPSTCAGRECLLARAVLAFVPSGDVSAPEGYEIYECNAPGFEEQSGIRSPRGEAIVAGDAVTMRALGLALVAQADALSSQGDGGEGGR